MTPTKRNAPTVSTLAARLTAFVVDHVEAFVGRHAPAFDLPSSFAGYPVGADVRADLAFTLGLLQDCGIDRVADVEVEPAVATVLRPIDGSVTHTFSSYRVAETLRRFGPFDDNTLLSDFDGEQRANLAMACDSTSWIGMLDEGLPANYAAVLARCEVARRALRLPVDETALGGLLERTSRLIRSDDAGFIDDSEDGNGARYDIYSADVYLFTEPFASELDPFWADGARNVAATVRAVASRNGAAVTWGRSLGVLAVCHTIELAALAVEHELTDEGDVWLALSANAADELADWTDGTLVTAHRRRSQDRYRGPDRWLQLTFDCLGKIAWAAGHLHRLALRDTGDSSETGKATDADPFVPRDQLIRFSNDRPAGVWTYRSAATAFVVPFVGPAWADYLPAPRNPGLYEVPVDAPLPMAVPIVTSGAERFVAAGVPIALEHVPAGVDATWDAFPPLTPRGDTPPIPAHRTSRFRVDGHVLRVHETLEFDGAPDAIGLQVTETRHRPLRIDVESDTAHRIDVVDTDGLAIYRSFWSELPRVHQVDFTPDSRVEFTWSLRPLVRIATADPSHHYHRSLWDPLAADAVETGFGGHLLDRPNVARERLSQVDAFHLHWPEWFVDTPEQADVFIRLLDETDTLLVWTQHNLRPHRDVERYDELYQRFASAARLVVHHSEWGRDAIMARYRFGDDADHIVLPHGHFGAMTDISDADRRAVEREFGLNPVAIRLAIVGAPRREKQTSRFMQAFAATTRQDMQLVVLSLDDEPVPDDPRIVALPYEFVSRELYNRRLAMADAIVLPFDPDGEMLTTGIVGDVVGLGLPAIVSSWPYLTETLGAAGLAYASDDELVALLESLSSQDLDRAAEASVRLQDDLSWDRIAAEFFTALVDAGAIKG
jgi:hypothetical protein